MSDFWRKATIGDTFARGTGEVLPSPLLEILSARGVVGISRFSGTSFRGISPEAQTEGELAFFESNFEDNKRHGPVLTIALGPTTAWQLEDYLDGRGLSGPWWGGAIGEVVVGDWRWLASVGVALGSWVDWLLPFIIAGGWHARFQQVPVSPCRPKNITIEVIKTSGDFKGAAKHMGTDKGVSDPEGDAQNATNTFVSLHGGPVNVNEYMNKNQWDEPYTDHDGHLAQTASTSGNGYIFATKLQGFGEPGEDCLFRQIVISEEMTRGAPGVPGYSKKTTGFGKVTSEDGAVVVPYTTGSDGASEDISPVQISKTPILDSHSHSTTKAPEHYNIRLRDQVTIPGDEKFKEQAIICRDYVIDWTNKGSTEKSSKGILTVTVEELKRGQAACKK